MQPLTPTQSDVYRFLRDRILAGVGAPTIAEIQQRFKYRSPNAVTSLLERIESKGWIRRGANKARGITLTGTALETERGLPWAGFVSAGVLREAIEQQERLDFTSLLKGRGCFVLTVEGDSMIDAQIADGDYIVVRRQPNAERGQIAVVRTDEGEATLKYWFPEKGRIRLQPANRRMKPIFVRSVQVVGIVVAVLRKTA